MALSDDARVVLARVAADHEVCDYPAAAPCARCDFFGRKALAAVLPDGRTIAQALDDGEHLRRLTDAWLDGWEETGAVPEEGDIDATLYHALWEADQ